MFITKMLYNIISKIINNNINIVVIYLKNINI